MIILDSIQNFNNLKKGYLLENHTGYSQCSEKTFLQVEDNECYALTSVGCLYQIIDNNPCENEDCPSASWLVYQDDKDNDVFYNDAEDKVDAAATREYINELEPEWEEADVSNCEDEIDLVNKCFIFESDETTEIMHNVLAKDFYDFLTEDGDVDSEKFAWFCGCKKKFCDKDTRFNPYDNSPEYTPYTNYYFF